MPATNEVSMDFVDGQSNIKTLYIMRHAQGKHNVGTSDDVYQLRDPGLTDHGFEQCRSISIPFYNDIDLLCASPMWRALQTANAVFGDNVERGMKIIALPDAQEGTDLPSDTGSDLQTLKEEFGKTVDFSEVKNGDWYLHEGLNGTDFDSLAARAKRLRLWLRKREENNIVLVGHGLFIHHINSGMTRDSVQLGGFWDNLEWRSYHFSDMNDPEATLEETLESKKRRERVG